MMNNIIFVNKCNIQHSILNIQNTIITLKTKKIFHWKIFWEHAIIFVNIDNYHIQFIRERIKTFPDATLKHQGLIKTMKAK